MHQVAKTIADLHRRLVWRERAVAACWTIAVVLAAACALGLADYWVRFNDRGLRLMTTTALAAAAAWAVNRWWFAERLRVRQLTVARRVEARFSQLQDQLASALEFLGQSEDDATAGSPTLRRAVVSQAELALAGLPIDTIIDRRPLRRAASWAAIVAAIVALCSLIDASAVRTAVVRLMAPWGTTEWPRTNHLAFRGPPNRLAVGQSFEAELVDRGGSLPDDVRIQYRFRRDGRRQIESEWMNRVGDVMVARRENVREPFAYRAEGGDDYTMRWNDVEVVEPPKLETLTITVHPPAYTGLPPVPAERHLEALAGSGIEIQGTADEPLGTARIIVGETVIAATTRDHAFSLAPDQWISDKSGNYRLELENLDGVAGTADEWNLDVEADSPPSVAWLEPSDDLFLLPTATVPIAVVVKDNLAIARVELMVTRSDREDAEITPIELYEPSPGPSLQGRGIRNDGGESRTIQHALSLAPLELPVGTQLTLEVQAADFRPGRGKTLTPRRLTIIGRDELDARLADEQSQIARRLEEALALERTTRGDVRGLEIQIRDTGVLSANDQGVLEASELNQRRTGRMLVDPADGVPALTNALAAELQINGIDDPNLLRQIENVNDALDQLAAGPLPAADRALTSARKSAESNSAGLAESLTTAGNEQEEAISVLEGLLSELSGWGEFGRIVRELAKLRDDQLAHRKTTAERIGLDTLPLELRELSRQQRATLNRAAADQDVLARRLERIEQAMDKLAAGQLEQDSQTAARFADAVELVRQLAISDNMLQTVRDLEANRVGQALARESQIVEALQQVLDTLQNRKESRPEELIEKLRAAERDLAALRSELATLGNEIAEAQGRPPSPDHANTLKQLHQRQQQLRSQIGRLARTLERLQATAAGRSTQQAEEKLADAPPHDEQPADRGQIERAEQDLAKAAQQLAQRRQQAEEDWAKAFLERFKVALAKMVDDQRSVIQRTKEIDSSRRQANSTTDDEPGNIASLAQLERELADEAHVHGELLAGLRIFGVALSDAEKNLAAAAEQLEDQDTGPITQQAERRALERFEQIVWALEQTAAAANNPPPGGQGNAGGEGQGQRPLFDLFEVKLLRMLQADLNERTQVLQSRQSDAAPTNRDDMADLQREAEELSSEQGRLADLVQQLLSRENEEDGDDNP